MSMFSCHAIVSLFHCSVVPATDAAADADVDAIALIDKLHLVWWAWWHGHVGVAQNLVFMRMLPSSDVPYYMLVMRMMPWSCHLRMFGPSTTGNMMP